jgi:hypothetical protein
MLVTPTGTTKVPSLPAVEYVQVTVVPDSLQPEGKPALAETAATSVASAVATITTPIRAALIIRTPQSGIPEREHMLGSGGKPVASTTSPTLLLLLGATVQERVDVDQVDARVRAELDGVGWQTGHEVAVIPCR